jgi:hypothetical protein
MQSADPNLEVSTDNFHSETDWNERHESDDTLTEVPISTKWVKWSSQSICMEVNFETWFT